MECQNSSSKYCFRFAKRKLDESVFIGNRIQVSYAPQYENLSDTKEKLEGRRTEVVARLNRKCCIISYFIFTKILFSRWIKYLYSLLLLFFQLEDPRVLVL